MTNRLFQVQQLDECWAHDYIYEVSMQDAANQIVSLKTGIKNWGDGYISTCYKTWNNNQKQPTESN
jgi:hypothetical protein